MKKNWYFILAIVFLLAAGVLAFQQGILFPPDSPYPASLLPEAKFQRIPLSKPVSSYRSEISGMEWYGDTLILLPQFPGFASGEKTGDGALYALSKETLVNHLSGKVSGALTPQAIPFTAPGINAAVSEFDGFEAIAFSGDQMFLTIEASSRHGATGYLISGQIAPDLSAASVNTDTLKPLPSQVNRSNKSDETLLVAGENVITMYEVNGARITPSPFARIFTLDLLGPLRKEMPPMEYRMTDATAPDPEGRFWVLNVHWLGEPGYATDNDPIFQQFGEGLSHARQENVERLVEMQYTPNGIALTGRPPIQLQLSRLRIPRNWEAIARLDDEASGLHGFLVATDKFPGTVFAYIPDPTQP